jgi:hypothetical protein
MSTPSALFTKEQTVPDSMPEKGTGHLLEANCLISLETDFHSSGAACRRGWS